MRVLSRWFRYRKKNPDVKRSSELSEVHPIRWLSSYTTELLTLLAVLERLVELEPAQEVLLSRICNSPRITLQQLEGRGLLPVPKELRRVWRADSDSLF